MKKLIGWMNALWLASIVAIGTAEAAVIQIATNIPGVTAVMHDNTEDFTLTLSGGPVTQDATFSWNGGVNWPVNFNLNLTETLGSNASDTVSLTGSVYHAFLPHETSPGAPLLFGFSLENGAKVSFDGQSSNIDMRISESHQTHFDNYTGKANALFVGNVASREINSWTIVLQGVHAALPVAEPPLTLSLCCGLLMLAGASRRLRWVTV